MLVITSANAHEHGSVLSMMHVDRRRVFVDWLGWDVPHDGHVERDQFDDEHAEYLVLLDERSGGHMASVRLLPTLRPHILGDVFPHLCEQAPPRAAGVREITRLCVSPDCPPGERIRARRRLLSALAEYGMMFGLTGYTLVTEAGFLARIAAVGWRCEMLGMPARHREQILGAMIVHLDADTIPALRRSGVYDAQLRMRMRERAA